MYFCCADGELKSGLAKRDSGIVVDLLGLHRLDDGDVVDDFGGVRQQLAEPGTLFAVLRELEDGRRSGKFGLKGTHAGEALAHADRFRQIGAALFRESRFVVEQIELGGRAVLEEIDDAFGGGRKVRVARNDTGDRCRGRFGREQG